MMTQLTALDTHALAQSRASAALTQLAALIQVDTTEEAIVQQGKTLLIEHGLPETWYYDVPVLAYVGDRTTLSMSGREYQATPTKVKSEDIVTIALSPKLEGHWAALARSFIVHKGKVVTDLTAPRTIYTDVMQFQHELHNQLLTLAHPAMTFDTLYQTINAHIHSAQYINLDYHGNLGHSLEKTLSQRKFIEKNNQTRLGDCGIFAFETHIGQLGKNVGSKHENIYYFNENKLTLLPVRPACY